MPLDASSGLRLAADIGGTFTDIAVFDERPAGSPSARRCRRRDNLVAGINAGVAKAETEYGSVGLFLHGSTIAINTILERTGAKTALLITEGFRDIYEIGRINRPDSYNLFFQKHVPLVERALRFEVKERVLADGEVERPLDEARDRALRRRSLARLGIEAVAILFLHCYRNPDHEARAKAILERNHPAMFVSASHELSQEYREFERCSTVVANAYIGPKVRSYIGEIDDHLRKSGFHGSFLVVQSTGGLYEADQAQSLLRAHAGIGTGRGRHRHAHAVPHIGARERDRLRHGRHHGEGGRHLQGRAAHHRLGAARRLREGAARSRSR